MVVVFSMVFTGPNRVPHLLSWLPSASIWLWRPRKTEYPSLNSRALYFWILFLKTLPGNSKPHDKFIRTVNTAIKTDIHRMRSRSSCKGGRVCTWSWPVCLKHDRIIHWQWVLLMCSQTSKWRLLSTPLQHIGQISQIRHTNSGCIVRAGCNMPMDHIYTVIIWSEDSLTLWAPLCCHFHAQDP